MDLCGAQLEQADEARGNVFLEIPTKGRWIADVAMG